MKHVKHVKYVLPVDQYIKHVPDYSAFGRKAALRMNPNKIPDLHWQISRYIPHHKYWTIRTPNFQYNYPKCGCPYTKSCWRKEI